MLAGACAGVTGTGDCIRSGWSPNWLPPSAFSDEVDGLLSSLAECVCPYCIVERAVGNVPGFNRAKANRLMALLDTFNCLRAQGSRSTGHTHLYDFANEQLFAARATPPTQSERGY
jgi:hypothetical protein